MSAAVLAAIERELSRWEWQQRLAQRPAVDSGVDAVDLLNDVRRSRDAEFE